MKISAIVILAFILLVPYAAQAVDFRIRGQWIMSFGYGQNGTFEGSYKGHTGTGFEPGEDNFEAKQKFSLHLEAVASEHVSGNLHITTGDNLWGKERAGGALGADVAHVKLKNAFIDWVIPEIHAKARLGLQNLTMPAMASGYTSFSDTVGAVVLNWRPWRHVGFTAFWARPYNDNYIGNPDANDANFLDNVDMTGLMWPFAWDGYNITPWALYCALGENAFREWHAEDRYALDNGGDMASLFPVGGARHRDFSDANGRKIGPGRAWWAGITGQITIHDPFLASFDLEMGSVRWDSDARLNRQGWFATVLLEWQNDWGSPGVYAWYASGDDSNPANGSERLPGVSPTSGNFSFFAFDGSPYMARSSVVGNNMCGTMGMGCRIEDLSFIPQLTHTVRINYITGTNSRVMAKKMSLAGMWINGSELEPKHIGRGKDLGLPSLYMTEGDKAFEAGATSVYRLAENFSICLEAAYVSLWLDTDTDAWGARHTLNQSIPSTRDAWNLNASFIFSF